MKKTVRIAVISAAMLAAGATLFAMRVARQRAPAAPSLTPPADEAGEVSPLPTTAAPLPAVRAFPVVGLACLLIATLFVAWAAVFIGQAAFEDLYGRPAYALFDDAMISMRYGWNLAHGHGLVWNPGERVEGYTNLLMTLWMSVAALLFDKREAVLFVQVSGIPVMLGLAWATMGVAGLLVAPERPRERAAAQITAFTAALLYYPLSYMALMGMETGLVALLLTLGVLAAFRAARGARVWERVLPILLGLAALARPDTLLPAALILAYLAFATRSPRRVVLAAALTLAFPLAQLAFRLAYYGELAPNTYMLKMTGMPLDARLANGWGFVQPFLQSAAFPLAAAFSGAVFAPRRERLLVVGMAAALLGYQVYIGGDVWPLWRLISPVMPLVLALFITTMFAAARVVAGEALPPFARVPAAWGARLALLALALHALNYAFLDQMTFAVRPYQHYDNTVNMGFAQAVEAVTTPDATIGSFYAGLIPYYTGRRAVDFLGKMDARIARLPPDLSGAVAWYGMTSVPGHNKYDLTYSIQTLQPTWIEHCAWGVQNVCGWVEEHYARAVYNGVEIWLRRDAEGVLWDRVTLVR